MAKDNLSDEDKALFRQAMKTVKPLKASSKIAAQPSRPIAKLKINRQPAPLLPDTSDIYLSNYYAEEVQPHSILSFSQQGFPAKRLRELRQGRIPWEVRLDLHGFKPEGAQQALLSFILQAFANNHRVLLIIHGKGSQRGEAPILKNLVNHWLTQIPQVSAFHSALPKDGGSGAVYVLLKRNRED